MALALALSAPLACQPEAESKTPARDGSSGGAEAQAQAQTVKYEKGALIPIFSNDYGRYKWAPKAPEIGDAAPDFTLPLVTGETFTLSEATAKGDVVVVFYRGFW